MTSSSSNLQVLIVGGGIGGLVLGCLLEKAKIDYRIFERAQTMKLLGSAISLSSAVMAVFEQLGILKEILENSKPFSAMSLLRNDLSEVGSYRVDSEYMDNKKRYGYDTVAMIRPTLHNILLSKIPTHKLLLNKRVVETSQDLDKVSITCQDGTIYTGSVLIGGSCSYVQRSRKTWQVAKKDAAPLRYEFDCIVGVTDPLDPALYPMVAAKNCEFQVVYSDDKKITRWFIPMPDNRCAWMLIENIKGTKRDGSNETWKQQSTSCTYSSPWGPKAVQEMCDRTRDLKSPYDVKNGTLGDIFDQSPKELLSKVMLEEKFFETWHHGRMALMGDACHKTVPFATYGANMAIQDAVALANALYAIPSLSLPTSSSAAATTATTTTTLSSSSSPFDSLSSTSALARNSTATNDNSTPTTTCSIPQHEIQTALQQYFTKREPVARASSKASAAIARLVTKRGTMGNLFRHFFLHWIPLYIFRKAMDKAKGDMVQVDFLPKIPPRGTYQPAKDKKFKQQEVAEAGKAKKQT